VLAEQNLATVVNRQAEYHVGGIEELGDEEIPFGTKLRIRVAPAAAGHVLVNGSLEASTIGEAEAGLRTRHSTAVHFHRKIRLARDTTFTFRAESGDAVKRTLRIRVDEQPSSP